MGKNTSTATGGLEHTDPKFLVVDSRWLLGRSWAGDIEEARLGQGRICVVRLTKLNYMKTPNPMLAKLVMLKKCSFTYSLPTFLYPPHPTTQNLTSTAEKNVLPYIFLRSFCYSCSIKSQTNSTGHLSGYLRVLQNAFQFWRPDNNAFVRWSRSKALA